MIRALLVGLVLVPLTAWGCWAFASVQRRRAVGQTIRDVGPSRHASKAGTPTMGGLVVWMSWMLGVGLLSIGSPLPRSSAFVLLLASGCGALGAADDLIGLLRRRSLGLTPTQKLLVSGGLVLLLAYPFRDILLSPVQIPFTSTELSLPFAASVALALFVVLGTSNAMNLADGLDGLASGLALLILVGVVLLRPGETWALGIPLLGALLGFLWVNTHPARIFLGDVGSYFLGGAIAALALAQGLALILPLLAGVLVLEAISVILQVGFFRLTGRRLLRMSPLHHHFEQNSGTTHEQILSGPEWPEEKIVVRFWILQAWFVGIALVASRGG